MHFRMIELRGTWFDSTSFSVVVTNSSVFRNGASIRVSLLSVSTVGMPVTRHPPCSPGRAVCPHPVPRLYSRPRCKAPPSSIHAPPADFGDVGLRDLYTVEKPGELLPGHTLSLTASPVEPCKRTVHGLIEEAVQRAGVPSHPVVITSGPVTGHSAVGRNPAPAGADAV